MSKDSRASGVSPCETDQYTQAHAEAGASLTHTSMGLSKLYWWGQIFVCKSAMDFSDRYALKGLKEHLYLYLSIYNVCVWNMLEYPQISLDEMPA